MKNLIEKFKLNLKNKDITKKSNINPHMHWILILFTFFSIILCLILFSFYILFKIKNDDFSESNNVNKESLNVVLRKDNLEKVLEIFKQKSLKESQINTSPTVYKDPSL